MPLTVAIRGLHPAPAETRQISALWSGGESNTSKASSQRHNLLDLPDELLVEVVSYLVPNRRYRVGFGKQDLLHLSLSSRRLRQIASPFLYEDYCPSSSGTSSSLTLFIRTIVENRELAAQVKYISLKSWRAYRSYNSDVIPDTDHANFVSAAQSLSLPNDSQWIGCLAQGLEDAEIALLLARVPSIAELHLGMPDTNSPGRYFFLKVIENAINPPRAGTLHGFSALRKVTVGFYSRPWSLNQCDLTPVFLLPSIRVFEGVYLYETGNLPNWKLPDRGSNIENMDLSYCDVGSGAVQRLLGACKAIKSFRYVCSKSKGRLHSTTETKINLPVINEALHAHKDSLESFKLIGIEICSFREGSAQHLGSLQQLTRLHTLYLPGLALLGRIKGRSLRLVDILPSSIQHLLINWALFPMDEQLWELADACPHRFQQLRTVDVTVGGNSTIENESLRAAFARLDVIVPAASKGE